LLPLAVLSPMLMGLPFRYHVVLTILKKAAVSTQDLRVDFIRREISCLRSSGILLITVILVVTVALIGTSPGVASAIPLLVVAVRPLHAWLNGLRKSTTALKRRRFIAQAPGNYWRPAGAPPGIIAAATLP
jgi:ABC-type methionine transport system permease subunit